MAVNDDELEKRAVEELLKEANRGRVRSETMGPAGWMKCPLRSTNKRFLLNTLRPCAPECRPGGRAATKRGPEHGAEEGGRGSRDRPADSPDDYRKGPKRKRDSPRSHSQSSRSRSSSTSKLASSGHAPHRNSQSGRTRSRSPNGECRATKRSTDGTKK